MRTIVISNLFTWLLLSNSAFSAISNKGCLPENSLKFEAPQVEMLQAPSGLSYQQYKDVIAEVDAVFSPVIMQKYDKKLFLKDQWQESRVNAHATRDMEDNPVIYVLGGMARHPDMTTDGLKLVFCHELGHYMGGAPKAFRGNTTRRSWSSAEGQADYFATNKCLIRFFTDEAQTLKVLARANPLALAEAKSKCDTIRCQRIALAGLAVGKVFSTLRPYWTPPELKNQDRDRVEKTVYKHPRPQCRVDTFLAGALCDVSADHDFDPIDPTVGACYGQGSPESQGSRPRCWFNPQDNFR